jgi:predicted alpha/beta-fold hydrolase
MRRVFNTLSVRAVANYDPRLMAAAPSLDVSSAKPAALRAVSAPFSPPSWMGNAHVQTLCAAVPLWGPQRAFWTAGEHASIPLPKGGALHARVFAQPSPGPAALVVHGLGGTSASQYVGRSAMHLHRAGYHVACLDLRGVGEGVTDAPAIYHAGLTEDLRVACDWLGARAGVTCVVVVGFSMGGHVAVRFAGELGAEGLRGKVRGVAAVSAPLDLHAVSRAIERRRSLPYHLYILRGLVRNARAFARLHPARVLYDARALGRVRNIRAYDDAVSAPMHGFADWADYYRRASAGAFVPRIRVPTLFVHSEDDPMVPTWCIRPWLEAAPAAVEQRWSKRGGHVGFFSGVGEESWVETWAMREVVEFGGRVTA